MTGKMPSGVSAAQIRAARALLGWSRERFAVESGVPERTLARLENEEGNPVKRTVETVEQTLRGAGIVFTECDGVRRRDE